MKKKEILTVVTTTYNQEKYIEQAIKGVVLQKTNFAFKYIIVDDCSTDETKKIIEKYHNRYPEIINPIYRDKNLGAMDNFVNSLNIVDTKYLALCDGDDYWTDENKLQKQVDFLEKNNEFNICFHQTNIFYENKIKKDEIYPQLENDIFTLTNILKENIIPANTVVYRWKYKEKNSFKKIFPTGIVPGDHYVHLLHLKDGKAKLLKESMSAYRRSESGMWWLTSDSSKQLEFHAKYGGLFLNFYKEVIREFKLPSNFYIEEMRYITIKTIEAYIKYNKFENLNNLYLQNKDLVEKCTKEISFGNSKDNLTSFQKKVYLFLFDNKVFRQKFKRKVFKK